MFEVCIFPWPFQHEKAGPNTNRHDLCIVGQRFVGTELAQVDMEGDEALEATQAWCFLRP